MYSNAIYVASAMALGKSGTWQTLREIRPPSEAYSATKTIAKTLFFNFGEAEIVSKTNEDARSVGRHLWRSLFRALRAPWDLQMELSGPTRPFGRDRVPYGQGGPGPPTSLRLGDSEDLRRRNEATEDLTRRRVGEFFQRAIFHCRCTGRSHLGSR